MVAFDFKSIKGPIGILTPLLGPFMCSSSFCSSTNSPSPVCKSTEHTIFGRKVMVATPMKVLVSLGRFPVECSGKCAVRLR